ncbi:MAG TPA: exodeoxyribonuclease V subunit alpha [Desulfobulbaceae bacterium]|nr:exodeoxyribonuclease V subunit alpha [Desulfobulbaceae bacterium]
MRTLLKTAVASGQLRAVDLHGALFLEELAGKSSPTLLLAGALASQAVGDGHICLPLATVAGQQVFAPSSTETAPSQGEWRKQLLASGVVGIPGGQEPLILDGENRLYLARYHACESLIAENLRSRNLGLLPVEEARAAELLARLFPGGVEAGSQKLAAAVAAVKQFAVISGGPGTGKTYTVARILALLQALAGGRLRIGLAAPTGRAAARLQESIGRARQDMDPDLAALVQEQAGTLHRLLGMVPETGRFRHTRNNLLLLDLLIIDEASMVDVPLMAALVEALPAKARLIMLGDRDQLTSVEAGSLFGDICGVGEPSWSIRLSRQVSRLTGISLPGGTEIESMGDSVSMLHAGYRFGEGGGIGKLARMVNAGDQENLAAFAEQYHDDLAVVRPASEHFRPWLAARLLEGFAPCFAAAGPEEALAAFARFRVLCALREGPAGVAGVNGLAEQIFRSRGLLAGSGAWYRGRPLVIRKNHYGLQLFNGDAGIVWPDREGVLHAWFPRPDGGLWPVALSMLPAHDTAYAATVHQAQGSEFAEVLFLLPLQDNRILSRELVYTALTRARHKLTLADPASLLAKSISRRAVRYSGLTARLWCKKKEDLSLREK